jgi:NTE family protein
MSEQKLAVSGAGIGTAALDCMPRPVAVVIGGGGCLGAAQVGVGMALHAHGFIPDLVVGTSVGALNGAIVAARPADAGQRLAAVWQAVHRSTVFSLRGRPWRGRASALFWSQGLKEIIREAGLPDRVEDLPLPFTAVATDLDSGNEVRINRGDLGSALMASAAIPGVLPPVEREGRLLVDGGVVAYVPVLAALSAGAASIVVVESGPEGAPSPPMTRHGANAVVGRAAWLVLRRQIERDLHSAARRVPTVVLPTGIDDWPSPWDFSQSPRLLATARAAAGTFLDSRDGLAIGSQPGLHRVKETS